MTRTLTRPATLAVVLAVLLVAAVLVLIGQPRTKHLSADFPSTISLYAGAKVKVLGVDVGKVDSIQVRGTVVHVEMTYDAERTLPADVHAMVVPPSIVGDRFVQLTPAYTGGPALADGVTLARDHTGVPVELDDTYRSLDQLAAALGPQGANNNGALSRLITAAAHNLDGNGAQLNKTIQDLTGAISTLSTSRGDIAGTVTNTGDLTRTLAADDDQIRALTGNLAQVSTQLNGQRDEIGAATKNLADALDEVAGFVAQNRKGITDNVTGLTQVTGTLAKHSHDLAELLDTAPLGLSNVSDIYQAQNWDLNNPNAVDPGARTGALALRAPLLEDLPIQLGHTMTAVCGSLPPAQQQQLAPLCTALRNTGGDLGAVLAKLTDPSAGGLTTSTPARSLAGLLQGGGR